MMAFLAPTSDSTVRSIKSSRACTSTCNHTSSGARFSSMSRRLNANSVLDAEGKPTSISLKPIFTSVWNSSSFWLTFMGTASAWLPSRKSTLHQMGARVRTRLGHCRSGRLTGGSGRYFFDGFFCMLSISCGSGASVWQNKNPTADWQWGSINPVTQSEPDRRAAQQQRVQQEVQIQVSIHKGTITNHFYRSNCFFFSNRPFSRFHSTFTFKVEFNNGASKWIAALISVALSNSHLIFSPCRTEKFSRPAFPLV